MNPIVLSEKTKKLLSDFKHEHEKEIIAASGSTRNYASWDKTIQFMHKVASRRYKDEKRT